MRVDGSATGRMGPNARWVGASVNRREDPRLTTGRGRYLDDIHLTGMLHAQFVRSTAAHARIISIDVSAASSVPGAVAVLTAGDLDLRDVVALLDRPPEEFAPTAMPVLARDKVRFVGEPIAIVVARDPYAVEDVAEQVVVEYDELAPIMSEDMALAEGAVLVHDEAPRNTLVDVSMFDTGDLDDILSTAPLVVDVELRSGRQNALPLETRGALVEWDDRDEQLRVQTCTQIPHQVRSTVAECMGLDEKQVRVTVPDMGGGFGQKCVVGREEIAVAAAAYRLRRPVKWIEDRRDALTASFLARQQHHRARAAFDADGHLMGLDADIVCDMGAYSSYPCTAGIEPLMASTELPGVYQVPAYRVRGRAVTTNKAPTAPYRGVSRPQIVMVMERLMEKAGHALGLDPLDVRRRNLITDFPYQGVNNLTYDPGSYRESLDLCEQTMRDEGWYEHRDAVHPDGRMIGIGYACFSERTGYGSGAFATRKLRVVPGFDISTVTMDLGGAVTATTATLSHGQGHETTMAQIVADQLGLPLEKVKIVQGDTSATGYGFGSFASRSVTIGGSAVQAAATKLADELITLGAHLLEADRDDVELDGDGGVHLAGDPDRRLSFAHLGEVAHLQAHLLPKDVGPGLSATASFDVWGSGTFSNATHGVVVELDPGTGGVHILRYICVEDVGVAINPRIVEGQARGGIAQGIAGALFEQVAYDELGQPLAPSFMEYKVPTASEIPDVRIEHLETPCAFTTSGAKGAGEGGTIGAPAAVLNAVNDGLRDTGTQLDDTPIPRERVFHALSAVRRGATAPSTLGANRA